MSAPRLTADRERAIRALAGAERFPPIHDCMCTQCSAADELRRLCDAADVARAEHASLMQSYAEACGALATIGPSMFCCCSSDLPDLICDGCVERAKASAP